jgi:uncharacterized membrane protein YbhN (UPF0104 family)
MVVLGATLVAAGRSNIWQQMEHLRLPWLVLAAAILLAQFPIMAMRWCLFARALAVPLPLSQAISEYFLATLLNQVLPLGVWGDVTRIVRHAKSPDRKAGPSYTPAALAVVLERASGQMGLWLVVLAVLPTWTFLLPWPASTSRALGALGLVAAAVAVVAIVLLGRVRASTLWQDGARAGLRALVAPRMLVLHLPLSLLLVALHTSVFFCIARAFGFALSFELAVRAVPLVLVATTLPLFLGGWGIREATIAGLYHSVGLASANGVSIAIVYGCLSLLASLPGLWALRPRLVATALGDSGLPHEQALRQ